MMLSSELVSPLYPHPKSLNRFKFHQLPTSKVPILITGLSSRGLFDGRLRVSGPRTMEELVRVSAFRGGDGPEREWQREPEAAVGDGSVGIGQGLAWAEAESFLNKTSKWLVAGLFGLVILWKHDAEALWAAMGSVVNSWLSITLKQIFNHQRPLSALRSDPGMPSSHAQSIFYAVFYAILSLIQWMGVDAFTISIGTIILIFGSYFSWLRISQQLHTVSQVLVGAILGSTCAIGWFFLWHSVVLIAFASSIWVRILVVLGSVALCTGFLIFAIQHWLVDEQ